MPTSALLSGYLHFFWAGLARHMEVGSILPSQRFLVNKMIMPVPRDYRGTVVELGSGNGTLTVRLAARCPEARIVACEINPVLAQDTVRNLKHSGADARVQVRNEPAQETLREVASKPGERAGFVISGLPLGNLPNHTVMELLQLSRHALVDSGMFVQVQHFLVDRKNVRRVFGNVRTIPVLLNVPPAFVYYARR